MESKNTIGYIKDKKIVYLYPEEKINSEMPEEPELFDVVDYVIMAITCACFLALLGLYLYKIMGGL